MDVVADLPADAWATEPATGSSEGLCWVALSTSTSLHGPISEPTGQQRDPVFERHRIRMMALRGMIAGVEAFRWLEGMRNVL